MTRTCMLRCMRAVVCMHAQHSAYHDPTSAFQTLRESQCGVQFALALFWLNASISRSLVIATTTAWLSFLLIFLLGGYVLAKGAFFLDSCRHVPVQNCPEQISDARGASRPAPADHTPTLRIEVVPLSVVLLFPCHGWGVLHSAGLLHVRNRSLRRKGCQSQGAGSWLTVSSLEGSICIYKHAWDFYAGLYGCRQHPSLVHWRILVIAHGLDAERN